VGRVVVIVVPLSWHIRSFKKMRKKILTSFVIAVVDTYTFAMFVVSSAAPVVVGCSGTRGDGGRVLTHYVLL
jgi:hypothetical protein